MFLSIIILFILICLVFIYFYMKNLEIDRELEELFDMYYENYGTEKDKKGKITVLNRKVGK